MSGPAHPPRWAVRLLEWTLPGEDVEFVLGDLEERFRKEWLPALGPAGARRRYAGYALRSVVSRIASPRPPGVSGATPRPRVTPADHLRMLAQDLAFAIRGLARRPVFSATVIATLALAIGVNTGMFTVVDAVLLRPFPYPDPGELVTVWQATEREPDAFGQVSVPNFRDWKERSGVLESLASYRTPGGWILNGLGDPETVRVARVSEDFFETLGRVPIRGRGITRDAARYQGPLEVVIGERFWRPPLAQVIRRTPRGGAGGRARSGFLAVQVALTVVLLLGTGLLLRTMAELSSAPIGFEPGEVVTFGVSLPTSRYVAEDAVPFHAELRRRLAALPQVASVAAAFGTPMEGVSYFSNVRFAEGSEAAPAADGSDHSTVIRVITPGYPATLGVPLLRGRDVLEVDGTADPGMVLVSRATADGWWPGEVSLGKEIRLAASIGMRERPRRVTGVVGDVRSTSLRADMPAEVYIPHAQSGATSSGTRPRIRLSRTETGAPPAPPRNPSRPVAPRSTPASAHPRVPSS